jgi:death-on-curing protein
VGRPYSGYYRPLWRKTGALAQSVAGNHGFVDGNKRTALILIHLLIDKSGYELQPVSNEDIEQEIEDLIVQIATNQIEIDQVCEWFRLRIVRIKRRRP